MTTARTALQMRAAEAYVAAGLSVIPLVYRGKFADARALLDTRSVDRRGKPAYKRYASRPATPLELRTWFGSEPRNLGILSGCHSLLVLDFDEVDAFSVWSARHPDFAARTAIQTTGCGYHVLLRYARTVRSALRKFQFTVTNSSFEVAGQLLGKGYYFSAWPSVHQSGKPYTWLEGQAPWEIGIAPVSDLSEIGIRVVAECAPLVYVRFLAGFLIAPRSHYRRLTHKRLHLEGRFDDRTAPQAYEWLRDGAGPPPTPE